MLRLRWFGSIIMAFVIVAMAPGQPPKRMQPRVISPKALVPDIGRVDGVEDVRDWLAGKGKNFDPKDIDPKVLKDLMEKLPKNQKADPKQIEELLKNNPEFANPDFLKKLGEMLESKDFPKNLDQTLPNDDKLQPNIDSTDLKEKLSQLVESGTNQKGPISLPHDIDGPKVDGLMPALPKDGPNLEPPKSPAADNEWVKWAEKNFGKSPAAEGAIKDLISTIEKQDGKGMFDNIPEFKNAGWKNSDGWGKSGKGDGWKLKPPDLQTGKGSSPKIGGTNGGSSWGGGGGGGGFGGGGGGLEGGGTALIVIAAIVAAILLALLLFRKWKLNQSIQAAAAGAGGPGRIDFDAIRSREELVRVFNAVSLEQHGDDARNWNHRVIADEFCRVKPNVAQPAEQVAGLYERARYAPADEDLTTGEFAEARRDLKMLAGVTA